MQHLEDRAKAIYDDVWANRHSMENDREAWESSAIICARDAAKFANLAVNDNNIKTAAALIQESMAHSIAAGMFIKNIDDANYAYLKEKGSI